MKIMPNGIASVKSALAPIPTAPTPTPAELAIADQLAWHHDRREFTGDYPGEGWADDLFDLPPEDLSFTDCAAPRLVISEAELARLMSVAAADERQADQGGVL